MAFYPQLEKLAADPANAAVQGCVDDFTKPGAPHANCMRSLKRLFDADPAEAKAVFEKVCADFPGRSP